MNIVDILQHLRPGEAWTLHPGGTYAELEWLDVTAKPTEQELLDAELAAAKAARIIRIKVEAQERILAAHPAWKQSNAALGLDDAPTIQALKDGITAIRTDSNTAESDVNALSTVEDVVNFTW